MTVTAQKDLSTAASYSDAAMSLGLALGPGRMFTRITSINVHNLPTRSTDCGAFNILDDI